MVNACAEKPLRCWPRIPFIHSGSPSTCHRHCHRLIPADIKKHVNNLNNWRNLSLAQDPHPFRPSPSELAQDPLPSASELRPICSGSSSQLGQGAIYNIKEFAQHLYMLTGPLSSNYTWIYITKRDKHRVVIMTTLSSLMATKVVIMTTSSATIDPRVVTVTTVESMYHVSQLKRDYPLYLNNPSMLVFVFGINHVWSIGYAIG